MKKARQILGVVILALILSYILTVAVFAAESIAENDTSGIYSGEMFGSSDFLKSILHLISEVLPVLSGFDVAGMTIGTLLVQLADFFYLNFSASGLSLSSVIYGRVGGALEGTGNLNLFSFEMVSGNFYGIASMAFYSVIRNVFIVIMMMILMWDLASFIYTNGDSRHRTRLFERIRGFVAITLALVMMPRFIDVMLYVRDGILYTVLMSSSEITEAFSDALGVKGTGTSLIDSLASGPKGLFMRFVVPGGAADICYTFRVQAVKLGIGTSLGNCICYFASVFAIFAFIAQYIGMALSMCVLIVFFPFACAMNLIYPNILKEWGKNLIGLIIVPVIDAILFCFPVLAAIANSSGKYGLIAFVQLALIYGIMPARGTVRSLLGLGKGTAIEMAGLGAMMGIINLMKTAGAIGVGYLTGGVGGAAAAAGSGAGGGKAGGSAKGGSEVSGGDAGSAVSMYLDKAKRIDFQTNAQGNSALDEMERAVNGIPGSAEDLKKRRRQMEDIGAGGATSSQKGKQRRNIVEEAVRDIDRRKDELEGSLAENDRKVQKAKKDLAHSKDRQAAYESQLAKLPVPKGTFSNPDDEEKNEQAKYDLRQKIAGEKMNQSRLGTEISEGNILAVQGRHQMEQLETAQRYGKQAIAGMKASAGNGVSDDSDILDKYADITNFESPEFKGISYERRAELTNERDAAIRRATIGKLVGAGAGGLVAGAGSMFYGPGANAYMTSLGMDYGSKIGEAVGYGSVSETQWAGTSGFSGGGYYDGGAPGSGPVPGGYETQADNNGSRTGNTTKLQDVEDELIRRRNTRITEEPGQMQIENNYDAVEVMGPDGVDGVTYVKKTDNDYQSVYTYGQDGTSGITFVQKGLEDVPYTNGGNGGGVVVYNEQMPAFENTQGDPGENGGRSYGGVVPENVIYDWNMRQKAYYDDINREFGSVFMNQRTQEALWDYSQQAFGEAAASAQEYMSDMNISSSDRSAREQIVVKAVDSYTETFGRDVSRMFSSRNVVSGERRLAFENYMKQFVIKSGLAAKIEDDLISKRIIEDTGERLYL